MENTFDESEMRGPPSAVRTTSTAQYVHNPTLPERTQDRLHSFLDV